MGKLELNLSGYCVTKNNFVAIALYSANICGHEFNEPKFWKTPREDRMI